MTENQYQRANRMVLITILIVFGFIAVTVLAALGVSKGEQPGRIIIQFITALVVMTASIAAYIMKKKTHICEVLLSVNIAIGYVVVVLLNSTDTVWTYGIPMIISVMVYLDKRLMYTERIRNSQISGQQELNADDTDRNSLKKRQFFIKRIYDRIRNIFQLISTKLQNIRRTFGKIKKNVSWWKAFIEHPRVTAARKLVWKHGKFLLKHIFPTRIEGQVTFSFEDPALTGAALAVLGMTIPFHKNCIQINPRFDSENYLYGNIRAKGRIYGFVPVRAAVSIYFNKNIKYVIKRWKTRRA